MKRIIQFFSRLRNACKPRQSKAGSSLALVMMIGAALVIWVMCITPLMTTTGTTAVKTEEKYDGYLEARSSIEFCKSELQNIVKTEKPYSFAVLEVSDKFQAIPREDSAGGVAVDYTTYVGIDYSDSDNATLDKPLDDANGDQVTAICAVEWIPEDRHYNITINTFNSGEPGQVYTLIYTPGGSLLIYPESYKQSQALPLSDFVVVDGKLGSNQIWKSTINMSTAVDTSTNGTGSFSESLLPYDITQSAGYADSGEYPAVFKKTADAAADVAGGGAHGQAITDGEFSLDETWIEPHAWAGGNAEKKQGDIWITENTISDIRVHLYKSESEPDVNITGACEIYWNASTDAPTNPGYYCVTIDYEGTGEYQKDQVNVLPISGLRMSTLVGTGIEPKEQTAPTGCTITGVTKDENGKYTVTLSEVAGARYGYCTGANNAQWSDENTITGLDGSQTYYFYAYYPATIDNNGVYHQASGVTYVGMVFPVKPVTTLENNQKYLVMGKDGDNYYAMTSNPSNKPIATAGNLVIHNNDLSNQTWTAQEKTGSETWNFRNKDNQYLSMSGKFTYIKWQWTFSLGTDRNPGDGFTVKVGETSGAAQVSKSFNSVISNTTAYLSITKDQVSATNRDNPSVYFIQIPEDEHPSISAPTAAISTNNDWEIEYYQPSWDYVEGKLSGYTLINLYANGTKVDKAVGLKAGVYHLTAVIEDGSGNRYCVILGKLTITKSTKNPTDTSPSLAAVSVEEDELKVKVSVTPGSDTSKYWIGCQEEGATSFKWFPAGESNSYTLRLPYGKSYRFAVTECGDNNINSSDYTADTLWTATLVPVTLTDADGSKFNFTCDIADDGTLEVTWYDLPEVQLTSGETDESGEIKKMQLRPYRLQLVFGTPVEGSNDITWSDTKTEQSRFYGVKVKASNYETVVLKLPKAIDISSVNGHTDSMMKGSSLYFMGEGSSINTHGNKIHLTTDLLVLNHNIIGDGQVLVAPYSTGADTPGDTLLFTVREITCGTTTFAAKTFYKIPANTDLMNIPADKLAAGGEDSMYVATAGDTFPTEVQTLFRNGDYPDLNLDIAYASDEQLAHILSSETIGWTIDGVLSGDDNAVENSQYVVCAFVTEIDAAATHSFTANRVLIAAKYHNTANNYTLIVPTNLTFTTRYLSIDADYIQQSASNVKFLLNNLGEAPNFATYLGIANYLSKSLQMDYERSTSIMYFEGGDKNVSAQICRYDDGTNIFEDVDPQELLVTYTTDEIKSVYQSYSTSAKLVDRYVKLTGKDSSPSLSIATLFEAKLYMFTNYLHIDQYVDEISLWSIFQAEINIGSQETGYTDEEYLGLFKYLNPGQNGSAESYSGTLIYVENSDGLKITYREKTGEIFGFPIYETKSVTIEKGFYFIPAQSEGTSLTVLAKNPDTYRVTEEQLPNYAVYINKDGTLSNGAYVDTGLYDNSGSGLGNGGFSGGNMG